MAVHLEGTLYKWTNYYSGWQPRWFILEEGILSYYLSASEVLQGCRGSVKVGSCEIVAHHKDENRIDIVIPKGRHIYVRACTRVERQKWLVALGSAKQEVLLESPKPLPSHEEMVRSQMEDLHLNCQLLVTHIASVKNVLANLPNVDGKKLEELSLMLSTTCDTFLNTLAECMDLSYNDTEPWPSHLKPLAPSKPSCGSPMRSPRVPVRLHRTASPGQFNLVTRSASGGGFSAQELYVPSSPSTTSLPSSPWNTIPNTSFEVSLPAHLKLRGHDSAATRKRVEGPSQLKSSPQPSWLQSSANARDDSSERGLVQERTPPASRKSEESEGEAENTLCEENGRQPGLPPPGAVDSSRQEIPPTSSFPSPSPSPPSSLSAAVKESQPPFGSPAMHSDLFITPTSSPYPSPPPSPHLPLPTKDRTYHTFFSKAAHKFEDIRLGSDGGIPTVDFLLCCKDVLPFFDTLGSTAFAPVKSDINGNIEKLSHKHEEGHRLYPTLQAMVLHELETGTHAQPNSATDALLWLKRAMEFVQHFLEEVSGGERSLDIAAGKAYGKSLRRYHNWLVRGVFNLAVKAVPYHDKFLVMLGSDGSPLADRVVTDDMKTFAHSLGTITSTLNQFYRQHKLDPPAPI